jgi:hypothetical protein
MLFFPVCNFDKFKAFPSTSGQKRLLLFFLIRVVLFFELLSDCFQPLAMPSMTVSGVLKPVGDVM